MIYLNYKFFQILWKVPKEENRGTYYYGISFGLNEFNRPCFFIGFVKNTWE